MAMLRDGEPTPGSGAQATSAAQRARRNEIIPAHKTMRSRVELILEQVEILPALSPVIARLLALTADDEADIREVITLIESDVALTSRVLSLCRRADVGVREQIVTVDRAVVLLGFDTLRDALLSAEVFEMLMRAGDRVQIADGLPNDDNDAMIDLRGLWRHSLAVASAAQALAKGSPSGAALRVRHGEAFVCGLLHDLGKWALTLVLPRTYSRLARTAAIRQCDLAPLERHVIGVDHHTAGRRLAERWGLPTTVRDAIWLHNQPPEALPDDVHKQLIGLTTIADAIARANHIGWSGDEGQGRSVEALCRAWSVPIANVAAIDSSIHAEVARRAWAVGLDEVAERDLLHESLHRAAKRLERVRSTALAARQERIVEKNEAAQLLCRVSTMLAAASRATTADALLSAVVRSVADAGQIDAMLVATRATGAPDWDLMFYEGDGRVHDMAVIPDMSLAANKTSDCDAPVAAAISRAAREQGWRLQDANFGNTDEADLTSLVKLMSNEGQIALFGVGTWSSSEQPVLRDLWHVLLSRCVHDFASSRLADQLAEANRTLAEAQPRLAEAEATERLFETTAGLAHEMNNPLAVISGRAELLSGDANKAEVQSAADSLRSASLELAALVSDVHLFATPVEPVIVEVDLARLVATAARDSRAQAAAADTTHIRLIAPDPSPCVFMDADHVREALVELVLNALQARGRTLVTVRVHLDRVNGRLMFTVEDDGAGMSSWAHSHCFDPFFSDRPAGRGQGLGLSRARRLVEASGGRIEIESNEGVGTQASIVFDGFLSGRQTRERA